MSHRRVPRRRRFAQPLAAVGIALIPLVAMPPAVSAEPTSTAGAPASDFPDGFLDVVLGTKIDDVKRALPKTSQLFEVEDVRDCPVAPDQKCRRIIEKPERDADAAYRKAEYLFNPFTMRLVLIDVEYRLDKVSYLDVRNDFISRWGTPTEASETVVPKEAFWPEGVEHTEVWREPPVEIQLVYRTFPSRPGEAPLGHVRFVHIDELRILEQLGANMKGLDLPEEPDPGDAEEAPEEEEQPTRLF